MTPDLAMDDFQFQAASCLETPYYLKPRVKAFKRHTGSVSRAQEDHSTVGEAPDGSGQVQGGGALEELQRESTQKAK